MIKKPRRKTSRTPRKRRNRSRFIKWLGIIIGGAIVIFAAHHIYFRLNQSEVGDYLSTEQTVAYFQWNELELPAQLKGNMNQNNFEALLSQNAGLKLNEAVENFGKGSITYTFIEHADQIEPVLFVESKGKRVALKYFESLLLPGETLKQSLDENPIYTYPQGQNFSFRILDGQVAISPNVEVLKTLERKEETALSNNEAYQKTLSHLPRRSWMMGYINPEKVHLSDDLAVNSLIDPLKSTIKNLAFTIEKEKEGLHFNVYMNSDASFLSQSDSSGADVFNRDLVQYIPAESVGIFMGGADLKAEWQSAIETVSNLNPAYALILEGAINDEVSTFFGEGISLKNDIYPLFENEYAVAYGDGNITLVLGHEDREVASVRMEKMAEGFGSLAANFDPKVNVVTLADGTESRELVPDESKVDNEQVEFEGETINCTGVGGEASFCYTITDSVILMTNGKRLMEESLSSRTDNRLSLEGNASFEKSFDELSKVTDEMTFVNFEMLRNNLQANPQLQFILPLTENLDSAAWVKHYFEDGVSVEGVVLFE